MSQTISSQNCVTLSDAIISIPSNDSSNFTHILAKSNSFDTEVEDGFHKNILIIGKRESGKTHMVKHLANKLIYTNTVESVIVISWPTNDYSDIKNIKNIYQEYKKNILDEIIKFQTEPESKPLLIIFDDVLYSTKINNDDVFKNLMLNGRNLFKISTIITSQIPINFCPIIRNNFSNVLMFYDFYHSNIKKAYENYYSIFPKFNQFNSLIHTLNSKNKECICTLNNKSDYFPVCFYQVPNSNNEENLTDNQDLISFIDKNSLIITKLMDENNKMSLMIKTNNETISQLIRQNNQSISKLNLK